MQSYIYIEPSDDGIDPLINQIGTKIRKIPEAVRGPLKGISVGNQLEGKETLLSGLIDELMVVENIPGSEHNTEVILNILTDVISENGLGVLFLGFTHQGMELGPGVGWRLGIPVVTNCVSFQWIGEQAEIRRPILGGKVTITSRVKLEQGAVISVQKGAWKDEEETETGKGPVSVTRLPWKDEWAAERSEILEITEEISEGVEDITKADILVSVGRGLGDPENLHLVRDLAEELGATISCSRPVVDLRWLPAGRQVGISGKTVAPVIYLALGISGQTNHVAGMDASGTIIAVNKDASAPIFNVAGYGVVDDILEFIPELIRQLKERESP